MIPSRGHPRLQLVAAVLAGLALGALPWLRYRIHAGGDHGHHHGPATAGAARVAGGHAHEGQP